MGNAFPKIKDGTAQGVAKVRHYEAILPPDQRLYNDPYAFAMYPGSFVQGWLGPTGCKKLYDWMLPGFAEIISVRTKWLDDQIGVALAEEGDACQQLIILGAGYDTRGFRLDLPDGLHVLEVDQPEVQTKKMAKLKWLANKLKDSDDGTRIAERRNKAVQFVTVDFNQDSLEDKLKSHEGFESNQRSIILMEGVTQYIPKESTADTLRKLKGLVAPGSTLLLTYVDQNVYDDPAKVASNPKCVEKIVHLAGTTGEPWISGWHPPDFAAFLKECGYQVVSDTTSKDYNDKYLEPVGRKLEEKDILNMERFVVAKLL